MKTPITYPTPPLDYAQTDTIIVLVTELSGLTFALLDYNAEPIGVRYPIKTFKSVERAYAFATSEGHQLFTTIPIR